MGDGVVARVWRNTLFVTLLAGVALPLGGCVLALGAAGGAVIADEAQEEDGFDPLEDRINYGDNDRDDDGGA